MGKFSFVSTSHTCTGMMIASPSTPGASSMDWLEELDEEVGEDEDEVMEECRRMYEEYEQQQREEKKQEKKRERAEKSSSYSRSKHQIPTQPAKPEVHFKTIRF